MSCWVDKVQAAMDARVLDVTVTHGRELFAKVRAMLVLNILHNWVPATTSRTLLLKPTFSNREQGKCHLPVLIVNLVTIAGSINNIKAQSHPVLRDNCIEAYT